MIDIDAYLHRIGIDTRPSIALDGLVALQTAHLQSVPFENLDVLLGREIKLDTAPLFEKIVTHRRGGYCFEANGLFLALLIALGFDAQPLAARVWFRGPDETPALTHTLNLVTLGGQEYLVDVGFGGTTPRVPVPFKAGHIHDQDGTILLEPHDAHGWMLSRDDDGNKQTQFSITGETAYASDLAVSNHYMATHPASHFTTSTRISLFTEQGRITMQGNTLIIRKDRVLNSQTLSTPDAILHALKSHFGLDLGNSQPEIATIIMADHTA